VVLDKMDWLDLVKEGEGVVTTEFGMSPQRLSLQRAKKKKKNAVLESEGRNGLSAHREKKKRK